MVWSICLGSGAIDTDGNGNCASIALDGQGFLNLCGATNSYSTYPLDNGNNIPYFQPLSASNQTNIITYNGSITRFILAPVNVWVGIKENGRTVLSLGLYPNPTSDYVLFTSNSDMLNKNLKYTIYDAQGRKLAEGKLNYGAEQKIDVSALPPGIYFINVNGDKVFLSDKFIKTN